MTSAKHESPLDTGLKNVVCYQNAEQPSGEKVDAMHVINISKLQKHMTLVVCCMLGMLFLWKVYLLCVMPGIEARELANVAAIQQYKEHTFNTFAHYPLNIYLYGSLQAYILSFLPKGNELLSNRFFSLVCLLLSYIPLIIAMRRMGDKLREYRGYTIYILLGCCYFLPFIIELPYTAGTPNFLGLLFSNCILFVCTCKFSGRYIVAGLLLVGCFLTKQYFLIAAMYIVNYCLFFNSFRNSLRHIIIAGIVALTCCLLCFISDQVLYAFAHHLFMSDCTKRRALLKFGQYICRVLPLIIPAALIAYQIISNQFKSRRLKKHALNFRCRTSCKICLFALLNVMLTVLALMKIGGHSGALGVLYFTQLLTPTLTFMCYTLLMIGGNRWSLLIMTMALTATSLYFSIAFLYDEVNAIKTQKEALLAYSIDISNNACVRGSAFTSFYDVAHGLPIRENGQQQFIPTIQFPTTQLGMLFSRVQPYREKGQSYSSQFTDDLRQGKWEIVYTDDCTFMTKNASNELRQQYTCSRTYPFYFPLYKGKLKRWVRNKEQPIRKH